MSLVSVIVPYRNAEKYISETLESIVAQTYSDFELICVDNGSTDTSAKIVDSLSDGLGPSIKKLSFPKAGKSLALNYAISHASGEWIAICDADDYWFHKKLEKQVDRISKDNDVIGTQMLYIDSDGKDIAGAPTLPTTNAEVYSSVLYKKENPICNSSVMYRKSIHTDRVGFYDPLCAVEDYDMWSRCIFAGVKFCNIDEPLVAHRLHSDSNFNSSDKQSLHKSMVDGKNNMMQQIKTIIECGN